MNTRAIERRRRWRRALCATALLLSATLAGCASWPAMERPVVGIASIEPVEIGLLSQQYRVRLRVLNRAEAPLEVRGVVFDVDVNGEPFARGAGAAQATVPRYGSATIDAEALSTLSSVARQVRGLGNALPRARLGYRIYGRIDLADGRSAPFDDRGELNP